MLMAKAPILLTAEHTPAAQAITLIHWNITFDSTDMILRLRLHDRRTSTSLRNTTIVVHDSRG